MGESLDQGGRIASAVITRSGLTEIGKAGVKQGRQGGIVEPPGHKLAHTLVLRGKAAEGDLQDPQMEAACAERRGAIGLVGMARGKAAIGDCKIACAHAAEPAAAAELLIDTDAVAGRIGDVGRAALDRVVRGLQLDQAAAAELTQRELAVKVRASLALEFGGDAEQALGPDLAPIVKAVMRFDFVGTPAIHGSPRFQCNCSRKSSKK